MFFLVCFACVPGFVRVGTFLATFFVHVFEYIKWSLKVFFWGELSCFSQTQNQILKICCYICIYIYTSFRKQKQIQSNRFNTLPLLFFLSKKGNQTLGFFIFPFKKTTNTHKKTKNHIQPMPTTKTFPFPCTGHHHPLVARWRTWCRRWPTSAKGGRSC